MRCLIITVLICASALSGCAKPRGTLEQASEQPAELKTQSLLIATSRAPLAGPPFFSSQRSPVTHFSQIEVSIPSNRDVGTAPYPGRSEPDPEKHILLTSHQSLSGADEFVGSINQSAKRLGTTRKQGAILVHGYNTNFAEAVVTAAQFTYDLNTRGVNILYSWPSAAKVPLYLQDRERALFARDSLAETLAATSRSSLSGYIVTGHSMGTFLVMETLRSLALAKDQRTLAKIDAVVLVSADLDIGLFQEQAEVVLEAGLPIFVIVSDDDQALALSARLRGREKRVGAVRSSSELGDVEVSIVDLSGVRDSRPLAHSKAAESELFLSYVQALNEQGVNVFGTASEPGLFTRGVLFAQRGGDLLITQ